jgi:hypothetical protein
MNAQAARPRRLPTGRRRKLQRPHHVLFRGWQRSQTQSSARAQKELEATNGCPVLQEAGTTSRAALMRNSASRSSQRTLSRARHQASCFLLTVDLHGRRQAITTLEDRLFGSNLDVTDLTEWNSLTSVIHQSHVVQLAGIEAVSSGTSSNYLNGSNVFTNLRDWRTGQKKLDLLRSVLGRQADQL